MADESDKATRASKRAVQSEAPTVPLQAVASPPRGAMPNLDLAVTLPHREGEATGPEDELPYGGALGRYLVLRVLGHGGMGIVYEAYDPVLDRRIAVKRLREIGGDEASEGRARMQREAQALARLSHHNVIAVHDVSEHAGAMYIAMELVEGTTLRAWQRGRAWREIIGAYIAAGRGLAAAHEAGLIHRDFKPDNVLVGDDGRVRVTDFGLARLARERDATPVHASPSQLASNLTADGAVMGTPSYMAPEQIDGEAISERSDQFAWCIALWEALYGEQPFIAGNLSLRSAAMKTDTPKPPSSSQVPRPVARILLRGLRAEPNARWPDMDALLGELERSLASRRIAVAGGALVATCIAAAVFAVGRQAGEAERSCTTAGAPAESLWSVAVEHDLARAFADTGAPFASDAALALGRSVAGWQTRWQRIAVDSCEATRVHATQSVATLDLRTACLLRARDQLRTSLAALGHVDRKGVEIAASLALPDLDACNDVAALSGAAPPPRDPRLRLLIESKLSALERVIGGSVSIERANALLPVAQAHVAEAQQLGWPSLVARARRDLEQLQYQLGKAKPARATLMSAAADASAAGELDQLVEIYLELVEVEARLSSDFELGAGWVELAGGTLARLGPRPAKQRLLLHARGLIAQRAGRAEAARKAYTAELAQAIALGPLDELRARIDLGLANSDLGELAAAKEHLLRALALARTELGERHPRVAQIQHNLGVVAHRAGKYAEAEELFRAALAGRTAAYGPDAVDTALSMQALGNTEINEDKVEAARDHFAKAIAILEARLGPTHPDVATAYNDIGGTFHRAGMYEQALANQRHVLALREQALGPDHPDVGESLVNLAIEAKNLDLWSEIDPAYRRALAIFAKAYGPTSFEVGVANINLGEAKRVQGEMSRVPDARLLGEAAAAYDRAQTILVAKLGADHPLLAHVWNGQGQLALARGQRDAARTLLERTVAMRSKDPGDATDLAESQLALAQTLATPTASAADNARALTLARAAREIYRAAGPGYARKLARAELWLSVHAP